MTETHSAPELIEKDKSISFSKIPTTESEKSALKPPRNQDLHETLRSEAFDIC